MGPLLPLASTLASDKAYKGTLFSRATRIPSVFPLRYCEFAGRFIVVDIKRKLPAPVHGTLLWPIADLLARESACAPAIPTSPANAKIIVLSAVRFTIAIFMTSLDRTWMSKINFH
jgi:hypothetical protein